MMLWLLMTIVSGAAAAVPQNTTVHIVLTDCFDKFCGVKCYNGNNTDVSWTINGTLNTEKDNPLAGELFMNYTDGPYTNYTCFNTTVDFLAVCGICYPQPRDKTMLKVILGFACIILIGLVGYFLWMRHKQYLPRMDAYYIPVGAQYLIPGGDQDYVIPAWHMSS